MMNPNNLSTYAYAGISGKRRHTRWDVLSDATLSINDVRVLGKRRKTRWSSDEPPLHPLDSLKLQDSMVLNLAVINNDRTTLLIHHLTIREHEA
ncbi:hypothetical protein HPP92_006844 [Vanilla planifolia]|uniref:Uncharacterized protein n=1 Tax=Vanilla planifolia TaxID=51239 RepID=A0A835V841_VANPL|nr:hypothetical protein HPP92_006844 [Vanilla planifolia]